jgi:long-subunit acyl-CoA synthetase (AMP-forming)
MQALTHKTNGRLKRKCNRPLSHVAANICDVFVMLSCVSTTYFADKNALKGTLTETLKEALPTLFFGVPRVWEKIYEKMVAVGRQNKGLKQDIGDWAKKTGLEHNRGAIHQLLSIILKLRILVLLPVSTVPYVVRLKNYS